MNSLLDEKFFNLLPIKLVNTLNKNGIYSIDDIYKLSSIKEIEGIGEKYAMYICKAICKVIQNTYVNDDV